MIIEEIKEKLKGLNIKFEDKNNEIVILNFDQQVGFGADIVIIKENEKEEKIIIEIVEIKKTKIEQLNKRINEAKEQIKRTAEWINSNLKIPIDKEIFKPVIALPFVKSTQYKIEIKNRKLPLAFKKL